MVQENYLGQPPMTRRDPTSPASRFGWPWDRFATARGLALIIATLIGIYFCYRLALPFLAALTWALTITVLAGQLHRRFVRRIKWPRLAAGLSVAMLAVCVLLPLAFLAHHLAGALVAGIENLQKNVASGDLQRAIETYPLLAWANSLFGPNLTALFDNFGNRLTDLAGSVMRESLSNLVVLLLTFYFVFYFFRDQDEALSAAKQLSPLTDKETDHLFTRISDTIRGVLFGTVIIAAVQGVLGGLIFWILGLPNPLFWGMVMALLAIIPVLGAFVVWIPTAIYLALTGEWIKAAILVAYGTVVIGGIDNILHPVLAGSRLRLHTVVVFIAIVGGLMLFGASGLILGPLLATMTIGLLEIWRARVGGTEPLLEKKR
jgi:predicted PurR-regulated permease PerM